MNDYLTLLAQVENGYLLVKYD